MNIMHKW